MRRLVFFICFILIALPLCLELFAEETITLTTYYPSPSGVYKRLTATEGISFNGTFPGDPTGTPVAIRQYPDTPPSLNKMQFYGDEFEFNFHELANAKTKIWQIPSNNDIKFSLTRIENQHYLEMGISKSDNWPIAYFQSYNSPVSVALDGAFIFDTITGAGRYIVMYPYKPAIITGATELWFGSILNYETIIDSGIVIDFSGARATIKRRGAFGEQEVVWH